MLNLCQVSVLPPFVIDNPLSTNMLRPPLLNLHVLFLFLTSFLYASAQELELIRSRRVDILMGSLGTYGSIPTWSVLVPPPLLKAI